MFVECFFDGCIGEFSEEGINFGIVFKNFIILFYSFGYGYLGCFCMVVFCGRNRVVFCFLDFVLFNGLISLEIGVVCILGICNWFFFVFVVLNDCEGVDGKNYDMEGFLYYGCSYVCVSCCFVG